MGDHWLRGLALHLEVVVAMNDELCCKCDQPTGRAGRSDDSLYTEDDEGPFCWECFQEVEEQPLETM